MKPDAQVRKFTFYPSHLHQDLGVLAEDSDSKEKTRQWAVLYSSQGTER